MSLVISPEMGYFLMGLVGDGCIATLSNEISMNVTDRPFAETWARCFSTAFNIPMNIIGPYLSRRKNATPIYRARKCNASIKSQILTNYVNKKGKYLWSFHPAAFNAFANMKKEDLGFSLRGFFDAEGSVIIGKKRSITATNTSKEGIEQIKALLECLQIYVRRYKYVDKRPNYRACYALRIGGQKDLRLFNMLISFSIPRKRNALQALLNAYKTPPRMRYTSDAKVAVTYLHKVGYTHLEIAHLLDINTNTLQHWIYGRPREHESVNT